MIFDCICIIKNVLGIVCVRIMACCDLVNFVNLNLLKTATLARWSRNPVPCLPPPLPRMPWEGRARALRRAVARSLELKSATSSPQRWRTSKNCFCWNFDFAQTCLTFKATQIISQPLKLPLTLVLSVSEDSFLSVAKWAVLSLTRNPYLSAAKCADLMSHSDCVSTQREWKPEGVTGNWEI